MIRKVAAFILIFFSIAGCVQTNFNLATRQQDYTITTTSREVDIGRKLARKVTEELELLADTSMQDRVRAIGAKIVAVCDRRELIYSFAVVDVEEVNAFSLPGGYVFINRGLIEKTSTDDELAGVIAHEVAHIAARHAVSRYESGLGLQLFQLASIATGRGKVAQGVSIATNAARLAYARKDELEADRLSVSYMQAAGFDPTGLLTFLEALHDLHRKRTRYLPYGLIRPQYALTHPYIPDRLRTVKEAIYGVADYIDYLNTSE